MSLDPYFGKYTGQGVACERDINQINNLCRSIALSADLVWLLKDPSASLARFDLHKSAQALRDAADRLDQLAGRQPVAEAAE